MPTVALKLGHRLLTSRCPEFLVPGSCLILPVQYFLVCDMSPPKLLHVLALVSITILYFLMLNALATSHGQSFAFAVEAWPKDFCVQGHLWRCLG